MGYEPILLVGVTLLTRLVPRLIRPSALDSDTWYHLLAAERIRENRFRLPERLRGLCFPGPYDYPPLFHYLLALAPRRAMPIAERLVSPLIDSLYVALVYSLLRRLLIQEGVPPSDAAARALALSLAFVVSPALLYTGRGPRAYNANPRVLSELLFAAAMATTLAWFLSGSLLPFAGGAVLVALLLLTSKFGAQVVAFFFPPMAVALGSAALLAVPALGLLLAVLVTRAHYLRVLKGHLGHLALFAQVRARHDSPTGWSSEWREFFGLLRGLVAWRLNRAGLYRLFFINSIAAVVLRNPQLLVLGAFAWRVPAEGPPARFLWTWTLVSLAVFLVVSVRPLLFLGEAERYVAYSLPAQFALLALAWSALPPLVWHGLLSYSLLLSAGHQAAFVQIHRHAPDRRREIGQLLEFLRAQSRTLRILPVAESPHKLAYASSHEIFYPCGNFQVWHTPVHEFLRIYGRFLQPRFDTLHETTARYSIDAVLVNKRGDPHGLSHRLHGHPVLFENEGYVVYDVKAHAPARRAPSPAEAAHR